MTRVRMNASMSLIGRINARSYIVALSVLSVLSALKDLGGVFALAYATDRVISGDGVTEALFLMLGVMLAGTLIFFFDTYMRGRFDLFARDQLINIFTEQFRLFRVSAKNLDAMEKRQNLFTEDIPVVVQWFRDTLPAVIQLVAYILGALIYSFSQSVKLTLLVVPVIVILMPLLSRITQKLTKSVTAEREYADRSMQAIAETIGDADFITASGIETAVTSRVDHLLEERMHAEVVGNRLRARTATVSAVLSFLPGVISAIAAGYMFMSGEITVGFVIAFIQMMLGRFSYAIPKVAQFLQETRTADVHSQRIIDYLDIPHESDQMNVLAEPETDELLVFRDVSFAYPDKSDVLKRVNLTVRREEHIAVVGDSGSGKSTLLKLMLGLYREPGDYRGTITFKGIDLTLWSGDTFREHVAPVFQESRLFSGTIYDNLRRVNSQDLADLEDPTSDDGMNEILQDMDIHPEELTQEVRDSGRNFSGGERQRIAVARALIKNADVYLMDEPSSALDQVTENRLQELLDRVMLERTCITVSHKLHTIQDADRIYYLEKGQIIETGTHNELMALGGAYYSAYRLQDAELKEGRYES